MENCGDINLDTYVQRTPDKKLSPDEASIFFFQIIEAVEAVHKKGAYHGNIKAANFFLQKDKTLKLLSFGYASWQSVSSFSQKKNSEKPPPITNATPQQQDIIHSIHILEYMLNRRLSIGTDLSGGDFDGLGDLARRVRDCGG